jgi:hypothetical protein
VIVVYIRWGTGCPHSVLLRHGPLRDVPHALAVTWRRARLLSCDWPRLDFSSRVPALRLVNCPSVPPSAGARENVFRYTMPVPAEAHEEGDGRGQRTPQPFAGAFSAVHLVFLLRALRHLRCRRGLTTKKGSASLVPGNVGEPERRSAHGVRGHRGPGRWWGKSGLDGRRQQRCGGARDKRKPSDCQRLGPDAG